MFTVVKNKILLRFTLPYVIILICSIMIGILVHNKTFKVLQQEVEKANISLLEQGISGLEKQLENIDSFVWRMSNNPNIVRMQQVNDPYQKDNIYRMIKIKEQLQDYSRLNNNFTLDYFILFNKSEMFLNNHLIEKNSKLQNYLLFEDRESDYIQYLSKENFFQKILSAETIQLKGESYLVLPHLQTLGSNYSQGIIITLIDHQEIQSLFRGLDLSKDGWAYIVDGDGNILSYFSKESSNAVIDLEGKEGKGVLKQTINSEEMMITYVTSNYNDWTYVVAQPSYIVLEKINYIKKITYAIFFSFLAVGFLAALYLANRHSKPLQRLVNTILEFTPGSSRKIPDTYGFIEGKVSNIIKSNENLHNQIQKQLPFIQSTFFEQLLRGEFYTDQEILTLMDNARIHLNGKYYVVSIVYINELDVRYAQASLTKEYIRETLNLSYRLHEIEKKKIAVIIAYATDDQHEMLTEINEYFANLQEHLYKKHRMNSTVSLGNIYNQLIDIPRSFAEAEQALMRNNENKVIWFSEVLQQNHGYYYPEKIELKLTNYVKSGDTKELNALLKKIYYLNFEEKSLSFIMLRLLLFDMWGTMVKLTDQVDVEDSNFMESLFVVLNELEATENIDLNYHQLSGKFLKLGQLIEMRKKEERFELIEQIKAYINEHYTSSNLSLVIIADNFNVSEPYLSTFFKEKTGTTFFEYLENMRLERAKKLLRHTELPIGEIAQEIGYNSLSTFGRAFKRTTGVSAMMYRNLDT